MMAKSFVVRPVESPPGEGTRWRPDGGTRQRLGPGYFSSTHRGFLSFLSLLSFFFIFCFFALALFLFIFTFLLFIYFLLF